VLCPSVDIQGCATTVTVTVPPDVYVCDIRIISGRPSSIAANINHCSNDNLCNVQLQRMRGSKGFSKKHRRISHEYVWIKALKDIKAGDELIVNYGNTYDCVIECQMLPITT